MFQVLIVDDEQSVLTLLSNTINWQELELSLAGTAADGEQALEIIRRKPVDIVITDIRMQKLSGLELSKILYQQYPSIKLIIMSGYAEFSYAQKALTYGALGYCLKPVETEDIIQLLLKAIGKLRSEKNILSNDSILEYIYTNDTPNIRKYLMQHGIFTDNVCTAVTTGTKPLPEELYDGVRIRLSNTQWAYITKDRISSGAAAALQDTFDGYGSLPGPVDITDLHHAVRQCQRQAYQYFITPEMKLCFGHDDQMSLPFLNELLSQVSPPYADGVLQLLQKLQSPSYRQLFSIKGALQLYNTIRYSGLLKEEDDFPDYYEHLVQRFQTFENELSCLISQLSQVKDKKDIGQNISNSNLLEMLVYINANFNRDISLSQVAERFNFNSSYLSQAFKKETGETSTRYLTALRINKAKEILNSSDDTIEMVANKVGYSDYFYFMKIFKKVTGKTPNQFRFGV